MQSGARLSPAQKRKTAQPSWYTAESRLCLQPLDYPGVMRGVTLDSSIDIRRDLAVSLHTIHIPQWPRCAGGIKQVVQTLLNKGAEVNAQGGG
jgi:hypothetical protein